MKEENKIYNVLFVNQLLEKANQQDTNKHINAKLIYFDIRTKTQYILIIIYIYNHI